jgi:iron(III) transport system substrate-binding protein
MQAFIRGVGAMSFAALTLIFLLVVSGSARAQTDWKAEWEKTLAAARKEGRLNLYVGRYGTEPLLNEFRKEYPEIKIISVNGTGNQLATRILAELRAGKAVADLFSGGANSSYNLLYKGKALDPVPPALILAEVVDESKWYGGKHAYTDPDGKYIFVYIANPSGGSISYNTQLVNLKDFKSYWDLLDPKWKGKITSQSLTETGLGATLQFFYYHPELGPEWIRRIYGTMDVTFGDRRLILDWMAKGKFALCIGCRGVERATGQGLAVDKFDDDMWKEAPGLTTGGGSLSLVRGAPHPNAARVFINWFLSRNGQMALQRHTDLYGEPAPNSRRTDIPKDGLAAENRLVEGRKYLDISDPKFADLAPIFKLAKEIMKAKER